MPSFNTNTVVLLVILGFLIYMFTSGVDCFTDTNTENSSPSLSPSQSNVNRLAEELRESQELMAMYAQSDAAKNSELLLNNANQDQTTDRTGDSVPNVFDYSGYTDYGDLNVADLDSAFEAALPKNSNPNVVDTNKNNVDKYDVTILLPQENNPDWFDVPDGKYNLDNDKLINTDRYVIGINTVGQSLKNASYDIRGTIPNPKFTVSPWNNSTYEPDYNIKPMC